MTGNPFGDALTAGIEHARETTPGIPPEQHDEGTSYCTSLPMHDHDIGTTRACPGCGKPQHLTKDGWYHDTPADAWECADPAARPLPLVPPQPWYAPLTEEERTVLRVKFMRTIAGTGRHGQALKLCTFARQGSDHALYDSARGVLRELADLHMDLCRAEP